MSHNKPHQLATTRQLLDSALVSTATKAVLEDRLQEKQTAPAFLDAASFRLLTILCRHLLAEEDGTRAARVAADIDARLAANKSNGWRYQQMPADRDAYALALKAMDETARSNYQHAFADLSTDKQLALLHQLQKGETGGEYWNKVSPLKFFEELLCEATELYYSYPYALEEIGFAGIADAQGWKEIGLPQEKEEDKQPAITQLP
ncbi:MAG: gluconate 2-dehydrogenase subunit 3 family protein [Williamsia sp.]|nr:gluconate 2-dehydrogenase subunit 3 family protein [Williamsia sp.]